MKMNSMIQQIDLTVEAKSRLREVLSRVLFLEIGQPMPPPRLFGLLGPVNPDFVLPVAAGGVPWQLACALRAQGQPRHIRTAALELKDYVRVLGDMRAYPVVIAPYISPQSAEICRQAGVGYLDFAGNFFLAFGSVHIERSGATNPHVEKRGLRSLFALKSARVLQVLLREPSRIWKVVDLAREAGVSLGQVSNMRKALLDREWGRDDGPGLWLAKPSDALTTWRDAYAPKNETRMRFHTLLHGEALDAAMKAALEEAARGAHALLASFSAAKWIAPYARVATQYFYADAEGETILKKHLKLESAARGENVVIDRARDEGVFLNRIEPAPGVWTTDWVQTYLDLSVAGERGAEAAEHLREQKIAPAWSKAA